MLSMDFATGDPVKQLITTVDDLSKGLDNKSQIDVTLLNYEKAFDKVSTIIC